MKQLMTSFIIVLILVSCNQAKDVKITPIDSGIVSGIEANINKTMGATEQNNFVEDQSLSN